MNEGVCWSAREPFSLASVAVNDDIDAAAESVAILIAT